MARAIAQAEPGRELARQVAEKLPPELSQPVILAKYPTADSESPIEASGYSLEVQVERTALRGKEGVNPKLAFCLEARATLRAEDRRQIYSCPVQYRSQERKFTAWAAHDAQLFRNELRKCYADLGTAIASQLVVHGLLSTPDPRPPSALVDN